jgi:hypothetical protein
MGKSHKAENSRRKVMTLGTLGPWRHRVMRREVPIGMVQSILFELLFSWQSIDLKHPLGADEIVHLYSFQKPDLKYLNTFGRSQNLQEQKRLRNSQIYCRENLTFPRTHNSLELCSLTQ